MCFYLNSRKISGCGSVLYAHRVKGRILIIVQDKGLMQEGMGGQDNNVQYALLSVTESFILITMALSSFASAYQLHCSESVFGRMRKGKVERRKFPLDPSSSSTLFCSKV